MDFDAWTVEQVDGSRKVIVEDNFTKPVSLIGGLDISFVDQSEGVKEFDAVGALVILNATTLEIVYSDCFEMKTDIPYVSGFLGFREEPFAKILFQRLQETKPHLMPQVTLIDGCGIYHPRRFGSASQIGVNLNIATVGISKSFLKLDGIEEADFIVNPEDKGPLFVDVITSDGNKLACAIYSGKSKRPSCFVSIGHMISLSTATELVRMCSISKIPEPIRQADLISRDYIRKLNKK